MITIILSQCNKCNLVQEKFKLYEPIATPQIGDLFEIGRVALRISVIAFRYDSGMDGGRTRLAHSILDADISAPACAADPKRGPPL